MEELKRLTQILNENVDEFTGLIATYTKRLNALDIKEKDLIDRVSELQKRESLIKGAETLNKRVVVAEETASQALKDKNDMMIQLNQIKNDTAQLQRESKGIIATYEGKIAIAEKNLVALQEARKVVDEKEKNMRENIIAELMGKVEKDK